MTTWVWIAQCLCPDRHNIMATAGEADSKAKAEASILQPLRATIALCLRTDIGMNPWCGLCGARRETWKYEVVRTRWRTMDEALPELKQLEAEQEVTRALWGDTHLTDKPN